MPRSKWSVEGKLQIVIAGLKGNIPITELCRKHGISTTLFYQWKKRFIEGGKEALRGNSSSRGEKALERELEETKAIIGELTLANELLKKALGEGRG